MGLWGQVFHNPLCKLKSTKIGLFWEERPQNGLFFTSSYLISYLKGWENTFLQWLSNETTKMKHFVHNSVENSEFFYNYCMKLQPILGILEVQKLLLFAFLGAIMQICFHVKIFNLWSW